MMKKFLLKTTKFILFLTVLIISMSFLTIFIVQKASFELDQNKNILVLGASSTECSINDTILANYLNLSQSAEAYVFTYTKLKKILETNTHIDTVLLAYTYDILMQGRDEWIIGKEKMNDNISRYISFLDNDELEIFLPKYSFWSSIINLPYLNKRAIVSYLLKNSFTYNDLRIGQFQFLVRDKLAVDIERRKKMTEEDKLEEYTEEYSNFQNEYLQKIIKLCEHYNVELILFNTPVYTKAISPKVMEKFYRYHELNYKDVSFIDCSKFVLDDSRYADVKHLNYKGAKEFSEYIKENGLSKLYSLYGYSNHSNFDKFVVK